MELGYLAGQVSNIIVGDYFRKLFAALYVDIEHCPAALVVPGVHTTVLAQYGC